MITNRLSRNKSVSNSLTTVYGSSFSLTCNIDGPAPLLLLGSSGMFVDHVDAHE